uniref:Uncharacterized protein n=1 Tax=Rhizophora mucronata TaxID=61149 RepID=A0A2P2NRW5_RHIMU
MISGVHVIKMKGLCAHPEHRDLYANRGLPPQLPI